MSTYEYEDDYGYHDSYHHDEYDDYHGDQTWDEGYTDDEVKEDLFELLALAYPPEIAELKTAFLEGRIDGSLYKGECACLVGTIAKARGVGHLEIEDWDKLGLRVDPTSPAERFCTRVERGDTPDISSTAQKFVQWIDEYLQKP